MSFKNNLVMGTIIGGASALIGYGLATIGFKKKEEKLIQKIEDLEIERNVAVSCREQEYRMNRTWMAIQEREIKELENTIAKMEDAQTDETE